jgi:beta-galactosidase/beta-glucuronidase
MAEYLFRSLIASSTPRPEHPEPQFMRTKWMPLNGTWEFAFDDRDEGLLQHWNTGLKALPKRITIPYCFESKLSGVTETGFHPVAWYRKEFEVPAAWKGDQVLLHFGAVDYRAKVWVDGQLAASHEGGNVPFTIDAGLLLHPGRNNIVVRAEDPPEDRAIPRGKQYWKPQSESIFYTRTSGIWQSVWLEAAGTAHFDNIHVVADQDGNATFDGELAGMPLGAFEYQISVIDGGNEVAKADGKVELGRFNAKVKVDKVKLWSPESPTLYSLKYTLLRDGKAVDEVLSYAGFRSIAVAHDRVTINGKPIYLKLLLDQGYWPESILTPPSEEAILRDIDLVQAMGFNGVRKHQKVEDPRFLYWADRRGLLVSGEIADAYLFTELAARRFTNEWMQAVKRDYNHPSIIIWNAINESWGTPDLKEVRQQEYLKSLYHLTRTLDPTRLVIDNEGWEHTDQTDLFAIHDYGKSGEDLYNKYKDITPASADVPKNGRLALIPGYKYNGTPLYMSEMGGIAYIPPGAMTFGKSWGYSGVEKTQEDAFARLSQLFVGLSKLKNLAGICYTQLTDVEQEANGLLTYDRKPKFDPAKVKALLDRLQ